jgi:hypothetical protein
LVVHFLNLFKTHAAHQPGKPETGQRNVAKYEVKCVDLARVSGEQPVIDDGAAISNTIDQTADRRAADCCTESGSAQTT